MRGERGPGVDGVGDVEELAEFGDGGVVRAAARADLPGVVAGCMQPVRMASNRLLWRTANTSPVRSLAVSDREMKESRSAATPGMANGTTRGPSIFGASLAIAPP